MLSSAESTLYLSYEFNDDISMQGLVVLDVPFTTHNSPLRPFFEVSHKKISELVGHPTNIGLLSKNLQQQQKQEGDVINNWIFIISIMIR